MERTTFKLNYKLFLILFGLANLNGLLNSLVVITTRLAEGSNLEIIHIFVWEFTGSYSFFLLTPVIIYLIYNYPFAKNNLLKTIPIYLITVLILGVIHTINMYWSRILIYNLAGWGIYDYGYLPFRYMMETLKMMVGFIVVYLIFIYIKSNRERHDEKLKSVKLEEQLSRARLDFLKNQIHPHFLFNTLNMISSTMYDDVQSADKMLADLSDLLRISLKSSQAGQITLDKEIEILNLYLEIMKARYKDKLEVSLIIDDSTKDVLVPSFILQPLVENSIKFGMETLSLLEIKIESKICDNKLKLIICDNGPGIKETSKDIFKNGFGMSNTIERLEKLYNSDFEFSFKNCEPHGLLINIIIPFQNEKTYHE